MAALRFLTIDVFTKHRFVGNPLAIVQVPHNISLSQEQKHLIAREFNLSETVILHDNPSDPTTRTIGIFTTEDELPFAGHPTVGTGWYLLSQLPDAQSITLRTKAGDIPVHRIAGGDGGAQLRVPVDFKIHDPLSTAHDLKEKLTPLRDVDFVNGTNGAEPIVSIVKGMNFLLLQLTSEEALGKLAPNQFRSLHVPQEHLGEWKGFIGVYVFVVLPDGSIRTRMFAMSIEDPATGSAASTLAGYLATGKGPGKWAFEIVQGVEMGRRSEISLSVTVGEAERLEEIMLAGSAVRVMEGTITV